MHGGQDIQMQRKRPEPKPKRRNEMSLHDLTSNQYWGGINRRFDKRIKLLYKIGIKFDHESVGFPSKATKWDFEQERIVPRWILRSSTMMHLDNRAWFEMLRDLLR